MTLLVATPAPGAITTLTNGIKIIRCADYIGAARGTLSTVSDSLSVAGTVVKDEQALSPATTFTGRWSSASDSITIPITDLNYPTDAIYQGFLGLRSEGSTPDNARASEFWNYYLNNIGPTVQFGRDGTLILNNTKVPTSIYEHYSLLSLGGFGLDYGVGATTINIRAWSITNASDPMAWYLDVIYLIPTILNATDDSDVESGGNFAYWLPQPVLDPTAPATDDIDIDIGQFSVLHSLADGTFGFGTEIDLQEADDEDTDEDWNGIFFNDPAEEKSYIAIVGAGSRLIKPETLETIDFSDTTSTPQFAEYVTPKKYILTGLSSLSTQGWAAVDGRWRLYGSTTSPNPSSGAHWYWALGQKRTGLTSGFNSNDPRTYSKVMGNMESFIMTMKCTLESGYPAGGDVGVVMGAVRYTPSVPRYQHGLEIMHKTDGTNTARLASRYSNNDFLSPATMESAGPTTVLGGLSTGGSYWVKIERRYYHWRAKVWLDGDSEPGSWTLEAHEPVIFSSGSFIQYPYTTGWSGSPGSDTFPVTISMDSNTVGSPWTPGGEVVFYSGFSSLSPQWKFSHDDITIEYDPDPAPGGSGDYTGAYFRLEKYDETEDWGTAYISPGALQVLYTNYGAHHFGGNDIDGTDIHGGNIIAWKEAGAKLLQGATYSNVYFRRKTVGPLHLNLRFRAYEEGDA